MASLFIVISQKSLSHRHHCYHQHHYHHHRRRRRHGYRHQCRLHKSFEFPWCPPKLCTAMLIFSAIRLNETVFDCFVLGIYSRKTCPTTNMQSTVSVTMLTEDFGPSI